MSSTVSFDHLSVGDAIPELVKPPIDRVQLALFAGASGDHNPIHLDDEAARAGGLPGTIAHGMLNMAFLAQLVTDWIPQAQIRELGARFVAMAFPGDTITCKGTVVEKSEETGERLVEIEITLENQEGTKILAGRAAVALP